MKQFRQPTLAFVASSAFPSALRLQNISLPASAAKRSFSIDAPVLTIMSALNTFVDVYAGLVVISQPVSLFADANEGSIHVLATLVLRTISPTFLLTFVYIGTRFSVAVQFITSPTCAICFETTRLLITNMLTTPIFGLQALVLVMASFAVLI